MATPLSQDQIAAYHRDGLVFARGLFDAREVDLLRSAMEQDPAIAEHSLSRADADGLGTRISLWNRAGDSVYGVAARTARGVDTAEAWMGGPVYPFQTK